VNLYVAEYDNEYSIFLADSPSLATLKAQKYAIWQRDVWYFVGRRELGKFKRLIACINLCSGKVFAYES
jgi:hypothetical protein